jgi:hypothetical protein
MEYNTLKPAQKKTKNLSSNNPKQNRNIERLNINEQNKMIENTPMIGGKLITELNKSDFRFEHTHPIERDKDWRSCRLIVNGKEVAAHNGYYKETEMEDLLARRFLNKYDIKVPGRFANALRELSWFLDSTPEKKIKCIDWDKLNSDKKKIEYANWDELSSAN